MGIEEVQSGYSSAFEDDSLDDKQPEEQLIKHNLADDLVHPEPDRVWGEYGDFRLVGHGEVTNPNTCGKIVSIRGCLRVKKHNTTTLDGKNYSGKVFVKPTFLSCGKPSCPSCYKRGWAVREAGRIEYRSKEASKCFGQIEHIVASVPVRDYHLPFKTLRKKASEVLRKRRIIGGCLIFHGFRYKSYRGWYWSPHFHCIGFVLGGYSKCRNCSQKRSCDPNCGGFDSTAWKLFNEDGWYVKVFGKRKTVFGTAWYQLNHATYDSSVRNFHVATWFGVCSYRKLKITPMKRKELCPICQHELVKVSYVGSRRLDLLDKRELFLDYREDGKVVWKEKPRRGRKGIAVARITSEDYVDCSAEEFEKWLDAKLPKMVNI